MIIKLKDFIHESLAEELKHEKDKFSILFNSIIEKVNIFRDLLVDFEYDKKVRYYYLNYYIVFKLFNFFLQI
jgi:hypothetical protein